MNGLSWLRPAYPEGHAITFTYDTGPQRALEVITGNSPVVELTRHEAAGILYGGEDSLDFLFPDLDIEELEQAGMLAPAGSIIRSGASGPWTYTIEAEGGHTANENFVRRLSDGTRTLGVSLSATAAARITFAEDGNVLSSFDPFFPDQDAGSDPARLLAYTGPYPGDGNPDSAYHDRLAWLAAGLDLRIPPESENERLPAAWISKYSAE